MAVTVLDHLGSWDPLWALTKKIFSAIKDARWAVHYRGESKVNELEWLALALTPMYYVRTCVFRPAIIIIGSAEQGVSMVSISNLT